MIHLLLTGSTGFLGKVILEQLKSTSNSVKTLGRGEKVDVQADLGASIPELPPFERVIHVAGKAHVYPKTETEKQEFFTVNEQGTIHLCKALEKSGALPKQLVFISTVAVYGKEFGQGITEDEPLMGESPYAQSKIRAEAYLQAWGKEHGVKILILRLPLVAGPNPPGNLGKMINAIKKGRYVSVGGGKAKKSMVWAEDVADLILRSPQAEGVYHLTDGCHPSFRDLEQVIAKKFNRNIWLDLPPKLVSLAGRLGDVLPGFPVNSTTVDKITSDLTFDDTKARNELHWKPRSVVAELEKVL